MTTVLNEVVAVTVYPQVVEVAVSDVGERGPAGAPGAPGAPGEAGAAGPQGPQGPAGALPAVPGADTQILFNDAAAWGASPLLTFDKGAQALRLYNTYTDESNYERVSMRWVADAFNIGPDSLGTGTRRTLAIDGVSIKGMGSWVQPNSMSVGYAASITGTGATAIGSYSVAGFSGTGIGEQAQALSSSSTALGRLALATGGTGALAVGGSASATGNGAIAIGPGAIATTKVLAIGSPADANLAIVEGYIGSSIVSAAPQSFTLAASGGSGTNIAGASLTLSGGRGTGTGAGGALFFSTAPAGGASGAGVNARVQRWQVSATGHFLAATDNAYDIGEAAATRPRTVYAATSVVAAGVTLNAGGVDVTANATATAPNLYLRGSALNWLGFGPVGASLGAPTYTNRSPGTKIVFWPVVAGASADYAMGMEANFLWFSTAQASGAFGFKWYAGTTQVGRLDGAGNLSLTGALVSPFTRTTGQIVSGLLAVATAGAGARAYVGDSTVAAAGNFGAVVAGGGAFGVPVWCDGAAWRIG